MEEGRSSELATSRSRLLLAFGLLAVLGIGLLGALSWLSTSQTAAGLTGWDDLSLRRSLSQSIPEFSHTLNNIVERDPEESPALLARLLSVAIQEDAGAEHLSDVTRKLKGVVHAGEHSEIITRLMRAHEAGRTEVVAAGCEELETWFLSNRHRLELSEWGYWKLIKRATPEHQHSH